MASDTPGSPDAAVLTDEENNTIVVGGIDSDEDEDGSELSIIDSSSLDDESEGSGETPNLGPVEELQSNNREQGLEAAAEDGTNPVADSPNISAPSTANPDPSMPLPPLIAEPHSSIDILSNPSDVIEPMNAILTSPVSPAVEVNAAASKALDPIPVVETAPTVTPSPLEAQTDSEASNPVAIASKASPAADAGIDNQKLFADMTSAKALTPAPGLPSKPSSKPSTPIVETTPASSLPPKPILSQDVRSQPRIETFHLQSGIPTLNIPSQLKGSFALSPSSQSNAISNSHGMTPPVASNIATRPPFHSFPAPGVLPTPPQSLPNLNPHSTHDFQSHGNHSNGNQTWGEFLDEERRHTTEARWEKFPEGSRLFVGNLSQERVSKRDVFDAFKVFGGVAQISLKSAYGFVQYYVATDAKVAAEQMEGVDVKGRRIHIEISKTQKRTEGKDRERSPDRRARDNRTTDRYEGRDQNRRGGDDYRPGNRDSPPRRDDRTYRPEHNRKDSRTIDSYNSSRNRSRSPRSRHNTDYRQRSPSPERYGRDRPSSSRKDVPLRVENTSDVQFVITEPNLSPDFIQWVLKAFTDRGLLTNVMTIDPHRGETRDGVAQRQVKAGAHAVADLDHRAQGLSKIRIQVFDRSHGGSDVRYDRYDDLDPHIAADVVLRTKATTQQPAAYAAAPQGHYSQPLGGTPQPPQSQAQYQHPQYPQQPSYQLPQPPYQQPQAPTQAAPAAPGLDLSSLIGQIDNATLQKLLATLPGAHANGAPTSVAPAAHAAYPQAPPVSTPKVDIQALLGQLQSPTPPTIHQAQAHAYGAAYPHLATVNPLSPVGGAHAPAPAMPSADQNVQVQNIMAQLAMYRK